MHHLIKIALLVALLLANRGAAQDAIPPAYWSSPFRPASIQIDLHAKSLDENHWREWRATSATLNAVLPAFMQKQIDPQAAGAITAKLDSLVGSFSADNPFRMQGLLLKSRLFGMQNKPAAQSATVLEMIDAYQRMQTHYKHASAIVNTDVALMILNQLGKLSAVTGTQHAKIIEFAAAQQQSDDPQVAANAYVHLGDYYQNSSSPDLDKAALNWKKFYELEPKIIRSAPGSKASQGYIAESHARRVKTAETLLAKGRPDLARFLVSDLNEQILTNDRDRNRLRAILATAKK